MVEKVLALGIDPSGAEAGARRFTKSVDGIKTSTAQAVNETRKFGSATTTVLGKSVRNASAASRAFAGLGNALNRNRFAVTNTSNQFADLAVQIGGGTSATIALTQQLPQLLLGFGALGSVLGAVAAIGVPLVASFIDLGEETASLDENLDDLESATSSYVRAAKAANATVGDLQKQYGAASEAVRDLLGVQQQLAEQTALDSLSDSLQSLTESFGNIDAVALRSLGNIEQRLNDVRAATQFDAELGGAGGDFSGQARNLQDLLAAVTAIQAQFGLTREEAERFASLLGSLDARGDFEGTRDALRAMASLIIESAGGVENLTSEQRKTLEAITRSVDAMNNLRGATDGTAGSLANAAGQANVLASAISAAARAQQTLRETQIASQFGPGSVAGAGVLAGSRFDQGITGEAGDLERQAIAKAREEVIKAAEANQQLKNSIQERAAAERNAQAQAQSAQGFQEQLANLRQRIELQNRETEIRNANVGSQDKAARAIQRLRIEQDLLTQAKRAGVEVTPELRAEISQLANAYATGSEATKSFAAAQKQSVQSFDEIRNVTKGFITDLRDGLRNGESFWKSFENAALSALDKITDKILDDLLNAIFQVNTAGSSGGGGLLGGLFGGGSGGLFAGLFHKGGVVGAGGDRRRVSPAAFIGAPRLHEGFGLRSDERPVILQTGEVVLSRNDVSAARAGAAARGGQGAIEVVVTVDDNGALQAFVREESTTRAATIVQAAAPRIVADATAETGNQISNGALDGSMARFGVTPQPRRVG